ncbi:MULTISPECIES: M23 family metallopeptidase [Dehalobacter]|uniref:Metalloendopeptidase n=1 Tax=Dehalobacter restrictus (strain DSM 9455 / PER-K23) TaxID=871738 RepID=A0ABN4BUH8_DEHRP|nr:MULTISPECIES: M23 family metallopeptidase [Dehalobacter]AHF11059.1 metalloendopeptidase [Dehalobacter restrictus DSM 9455]MCG1024684.1 peptidoglycan DD-metalloendopeptidase family protein [Dehalobacter sp.]MDJ0305202.1 peptidoglycan DD-metalloendopeptidase family protein [Dehalobacter sp.]OCZ53921.1 metalloendopeptidase [Dehalobacter sp. TeCB1]
MIKMTRPVVLLIVLTLMVTFNFPVTADELSEALKQQEKILNQQKNAEGNLNSLTTKAQQMEKQIRQLTTQISDAEVDLDQKENAHAKAQEEVTAIQTEVTAKQQELKGRQDTLRSRVRAIYEEGQVNYLEVLFQSTDLSDFISRVEYLSCLVENDQTILSDIRVQKQDLDKKKELLVAKMDEAESLKQQAEAAKNYLDSSKSKKEVALAENKEDQEALLEQIDKLERDSKALESKIRELQKNNTGGVTGTVSVWPAPGYKYITSTFGYRVHPITKQYKLHTGVDIGAPYGAKIVAAGSGTVVFSGWYGAYGNAIIIDHGNKISTLYGHMSSRAVAVNTTVAAGQTIGYVGSTGWSTGAHLHFEVRKDGTPTNPMAYF